MLDTCLIVFLEERTIIKNCVEKYSNVAVEYSLRIQNIMILC